MKTLRRVQNCTGRQATRRPLLRRFHEVDKAAEEVVAVAGAGRGFRVILHRKGRAVGERHAAVRAVEQRDMRLLHVGGKRSAVDGEAVVHRHDLHLAGGEVLDRVVRAVVALRHFHRPPADREPEQLMAEADAEQRNFCLEQGLDGRHGVFAGLGRVSRPVGQENPVGPQRKNLLGGRRRRDDRHRAAAVVEEP